MSLDVTILYIQYLEKITNHCQNVGVDSFDENDFKHFGWEQQDIDDKISEINNVN
jgi:hypothetical protein